MQYKLFESLTFVLLLNGPLFACCSDPPDWTKLFKEVCTDLGKQGTVPIQGDSELSVAKQLATIQINDAPGEPSKDLEPYILPDALVLEPNLVGDETGQHKSYWILRNMTQVKTTDVKSSIPVVLSYVKDQIRPADEKLLKGSIFSGQTLKRFRDCVSKGGQGSTLSRCGHLIRDMVRLASKRLQKATTREAKNEIMRVMAQAWGEPGVLADILETLGCESVDEEKHISTYDEFTSCVIKGVEEKRMSPTGFQIEVHTYQRAIDPENLEWKCGTCTFHAHSEWFASRVVAGSITHTIAGPTCTAEGDAPSFDSLDLGLEKLVHNNGTAIDVVGTKYSVAEQHVAWETKEVATLQTGQTVLFAPTLFHRVIPPPHGTKKAGVTFVVKYLYDPELQALRNESSQAGQKYTVIDPPGFHYPPGRMHTCWEMSDLIAELRSGGDLSEGISKLPRKRKIPSCRPEREKDEL
eukprot:TRINITY_DN11211_c2_g1_i1.p1 TRINITY_DN11211_c2_g1~~TRINITY_DN11211_c2_g1_i1.p1  ORF type:complete len:466 (-),score=52.26 TRINITY_DN11211_c2_g1_i1:129-1526(-)